MKKKQRLILLGVTGKLGESLNHTLQNEYDIKGISSKDFHVLDFKSLNRCISEFSPKIVINAVALGGIDYCEVNPMHCLNLNGIFPKSLAELSNKYSFRLIHFSTDAVFSGNEGKCYSEDDSTSPINMYGIGKLAGDSYIKAIANDYLIFRLPILFGPSKRNQFVERIINLARNGETRVNVSTDIISSPSFTFDIANALKGYIDNGLSSGLYHLQNEGVVSLYDLISEIFRSLKMNVNIQGVSHKTFPSIGLKNLYTPMQSSRIPPMRPWKNAVEEYCSLLRHIHE